LYPVTPEDKVYVGGGLRDFKLFRVGNFGGWSEDGKIFFGGKISSGIGSSA
jgi:hypothetical protein